VPNRGAQDFAGTGMSLSLYDMVGLVSLGAIMALISTGARIATERTDGWTRQLRITPLSTRAFLTREAVPCLSGSGWR
jgi:ABC-2 type transport system permease protein